MARKAKAARRARRSPEEMIADLEAKIREVKQRAQAKELKQSPSMKAAMSTVRSLDKSLEAAAEDGNNALRHALADARKPLAEFLEGQGLKLPKARVPRGRVPPPSDPRRRPRDPRNHPEYARQAMSVSTSNMSWEPGDSSYINDSERSVHLQSGR